MINFIERASWVVLFILLAPILSVFFALTFTIKFIFVFIGEGFKSLKGLTQRGRGEIGRR